MEREVLLTGIGGQGVQLAARALAVAAVEEGRQVMLFGSYGGMMRGGNSDATLVVGDEAITSPPTVPRAWAALALHPTYWQAVRDRLRPGGFVLVDAGLFEPGVEVAGCTVVAVDATGEAARLGSPRSASMVAIGAFAAATGLVGPDVLAEASGQVLPGYRAEHAAANARAVAAGAGLVEGVVAAAWGQGPVREEMAG